RSLCYAQAGPLHRSLLARRGPSERALTANGVLRRNRIAEHSVRAPRCRPQPTKILRPHKVWHESRGEIMRAIIAVTAAAASLVLAASSANAGRGVNTAL